MNEKGEECIILVSDLELGTDFKREGPSILNTWFILQYGYLLYFNTFGIYWCFIYACSLQCNQDFSLGYAIILSSPFFSLSYSVSSPRVVFKKFHTLASVAHVPINLLSAWGKIKTLTGLSFLNKHFSVIMWRGTTLFYLLPKSQWSS